jgi:hypothetical protein
MTINKNDKIQWNSLHNIDRGVDLLKKLYIEIGMRQPDKFIISLYENLSEIISLIGVNINVLRRTLSEGKDDQANP